MQDQAQNRQYCLEMVQRDDRERYLVSLFAPKQAQPHIWSLLAFNQEVAKIRESVSETALGEIRLQWWSEVLEEISAGSVREQPVIQELSGLPNRDVLWPLMNEIIEARRQDMFEGAKVTFEALETYVAGVGGALQAALYTVIASDAATEQGYAASRAAGEAWAMMGLIRALPYHWSAGKSMLPSDTDAAMQMRDAAKAFSALKPTILQMREFVEAKSKQARELKPRGDRAAKVNLLALVLVDLHLKTLAQAQNNPFETPPHEVGDFTKLRKLWWSKLVS